MLLCYFAAYLDRVNLSFAALSMNEELGFSPAVSGAGAGIFFLGYVLFEVQSNLALRRFGARRWLARIMLTWGVLSFLFAFIHTTTYVGCSVSVKLIAAWRAQPGCACLALRR